jgi:HK97 family phage prohead protease
MKRKSGPALKHRQVAFKAESVSDDGTFKGYGSVFGNVDSYGEIVAPGSFSETLDAIKASGDPLPMLWQHRPGEPIGGYNVLSEDKKGLYVEGFLLKDAIPRANEAFQLMKARIVKGLSIGYYVRDSSYDEKTGIRTLKKLDLQEVSVVTFPANTAAQIEEVKAGIAHGRLPSLPEFEDILREAGFSKSQAAVIANRGLKHLIDRSESGGEGGNPSGLKAALDNFVLPTIGSI